MVTLKKQTKDRRRGQRSLECRGPGREDAALVGITGKDEGAQILSEQLTAAHVVLDFLRDPSVSTITKQRVISRHQQLIRLDFEKSLFELDQQPLIDAFRKHLPKADVVILSDYSKGTLRDPQAFIKLAREATHPAGRSQGH